MKFFTADLLERFGSEDEDIALTAHEELEKRSEQYGRRLHEIWNQLPGRLQELQDQFYLHDARVIAVFDPMLPAILPTERCLTARTAIRELAHCARRGSLIPVRVGVQLDTPPRDALILQYGSALVEQIIEHSALKEEQCPYLEWLHDEIDVLPGEQAIEFRHSILFSGGIEVRLRFKDFDFTTLPATNHDRDVSAASQGTTLS
jgi:hypothetical protein